MKRLRLIALIVLFVACVGDGLTAPAAAQSGKIEILDQVELPIDPFGIVVSPNGEKIAAFDRRELCIWSPTAEKRACAVWPPNLTDFRPVFIDAGTMAFSPDGRWLAFTEDYVRRFVEPDLYVMDTDNGQVTALTPDALRTTRASTDSPAIDQLPLFSPDGQMVYFVRYSVSGRRTGVPELARVPVMGGAVERLAELPVPIYSVYAMRWLPGNQQMVMAVIAPNPDDPINGIGILNADGTGFKTVYRAVGYTDVTPTADGRALLAFNGAAQSLANLRPRGPIAFVHGLDGALESPFTVAEVWEALWPTFGPDGQHVAYILRPWANSPRSGLYVASGIGEDGELILQGDLAPANARNAANRPLQWAANGVMVVVGGPGRNPLILRLGVRA